MRAVTNCTLWQFSGARLATLLKHQPEFLPPLCNSYLRVRLYCSWILVCFVMTSRQLLSGAVLP